MDSETRAALIGRGVQVVGVALGAWLWVAGYQRLLAGMAIGALVLLVAWPNKDMGR
jgi:hypothetical protein